MSYAHEAVFEVAGGPARSPYDPQFNPKALPRGPLQGGTNLTTTLNEMDKPGGKWARFVSDGNPKVVAKPYGLATMRIFSQSSHWSTARRRCGMCMLHQSMWPLPLVSHSSSPVPSPTAQPTTWLVNQFSQHTSCHANRLGGLLVCT